jgi:hypothetical protein
VNLGLLLLLTAGAVFAQAVAPDDPVANPARPTVSTPATLTPVGYLQFENGMLGATTSPEFSTRFGINQVTRLAVSSRLQFILQSEPFVRSRFDVDREIHPGEVFAGVQGVIVDGRDSGPTVSVSYLRRLYASPAPELDLGTYRQGGTVLVSGDLWGFHYDANAIVNEQIEGRLHRAQLAQTLSISHPWRRWTIAGEIWHFTQPLLNGNAVGNLWAVSYNLRKNVVIDAGFDRGFTSTSTHWEAFAGFTYLLPKRLWR